MDMSNRFKRLSGSMKADFVGWGALILFACGLATLLLLLMVLPLA